MSGFFRGSRQDPPRDFRDRERDVHGRTGGGARTNSFRTSGPNRVNPWEGGVTPGIGGLNNRPMGGLLPTPTLSNTAGGLLQQLSTQEAQTQLAIASNMLSALLPSLQTQANQSSQVPSLLSLNTHRGGLLPLSGAAGPAFQGLPYGVQTSHDNATRQRSRVSAKRPEPYNKMANRNDRKGAGSSCRNGGRTPVVSPKKGTQQTKNNKSEDSKKADVRNDERLKKNDKDEDVSSQSAFASIPEDMFNCHVCSKRMWDAVSFTNHIKGRAHQMMIDQLEESYKIKIELMRHEMKVDEQQRQIEMERKQRHGKAIGSQSREYCTMCDLHFVGTLPHHRKSERHQQLKSFLHPKCLLCSKEFSNRLEWDHHQLTPGHLKNSSEIRNHSKRNKSNAEQEGKDNQEKVRAAEDSVKVKISPVKSPETSAPKVVDSPVVPKTEEKRTMEPPAEAKPESIIPKYDPSKEIGSDMLQQKTGYLCRCCNRFISNQMDAKTHCRSQYHYERYILYLQNVASVNNPNQTNSNDFSTSEKKTDSPISNLKDLSNTQTESSFPKPTEVVKQERNLEEKREAKTKNVMEHDEEEDREEDDVSWKRRRISNDGCDQVKKEELPATSSKDPNLVKESESKNFEENSDDNMFNNKQTSPVPGSANSTPDVNLDQNMKEGQEEISSEEKSVNGVQMTRSKRGRGGGVIRSRGRRRK